MKKLLTTLSIAAFAAVAAHAATGYDYNSKYALTVYDDSADNRISTGMECHEMGDNTHLSFRGNGANAIIIDQDIVFGGNLQVGGNNTSPTDVNITFENGNTLSVNALELVGSRAAPTNVAVSGDGNIVVRGESNFSASENNAMTFVFDQTGTYTTNALNVYKYSTVTINNYASNTNITVTDNGSLTLKGSAVNAKALNVGSSASFSSETEISVTGFNLGGLVQSGAAQKFSSVYFDGDVATLNAVEGSSFGSNFAFEGSSG